MAPKIKSTEVTVQFSCRMPAVLHAAIKEIAVIEKRDVSKQVFYALSVFVEKYKATKKSNP
jgi:hypothetical protein